MAPRPVAFSTTANATIPLTQLLHPSLGETYGALLVGSFVGTLLYGMVVHQAFRYIYIYKDDHPVNKLTVYILIVIDSVHSLLCIHSCYAYLVSNYFEPLELLHGIWSIQCQPLIVGLAVLVSQSFFARRVYVVSPKSRLPVAASVLFTFANFGCSVAGTVIAFKLHIFTEDEHYYWIDSVACGCAVAADMLTTSVLIATLRRSRTGFKQTDTLLSTLIQYAINTGLLTG